MAEFRDVMKQWRRMCANTPCKKCEIYEFCEGFPSLDSDRIEEIVTRWAEAHPEPVYPTWWEWLFSIGAVTRKVKPDVAATLIDTGLLDFIPADIAQKLDIKPLPIVNGDCGSTNREDAINNLWIKLKEHQ